MVVEEVETNKDLGSQVIAAAERRYRKHQWIGGIMVLFLVGAALYLGWRNDRMSKVVLMPQEQAQTTAGIQLAADAANVPVAAAQTREMARHIETIAVGTSPERVISTTGATLEKTVEGMRRDQGADFSIVSNPQKPEEKPAIKSNEAVKLNVYNIKAYPLKLVEVSIGARGGDIAYLHRVNVPKVPLLLPKGSVGYVGPFIRTEYDGSKVDAGLRIVMTF